jgi:hypothetical protein
MDAELYLGEGRPNGSAALTVPNGPQRTQVGAYSEPIGQPNFHLRTSGTGMVSSVGPLDVGAGGSLQLESDTSILVYSPMLKLHTDGPQEVHVASDQVEHIGGNWIHTVDSNVRQLFGAQFLHEVSGHVTRDFKSTVLDDFEGPHVQRIATESHQTVANGLTVTTEGGNELHVANPCFYVNATVDIGLVAQQEVRVFGKSEVDVLSDQKIELKTGGGARIVLEGDTILIEAKTITVVAMDQIKATSGRAIDVLAAGPLDLQGGSKAVVHGPTVDVLATLGDLTLRGGPMVKINT